MNSYPYKRKRPSAPTPSKDDVPKRVVPPSVREHCLVPRVRVRVTADRKKTMTVCCSQCGVVLPDVIPEQVDMGRPYYCDGCARSTTLYGIQR